MNTTKHVPQGTAADLPTARVLRRARVAAVVCEPRLQLGFDQERGTYTLAVL